MTGEQVGLGRVLAIVLAVGGTAVSAMGQGTIERIRVLARRRSDRRGAMTETVKRDRPKRRQIVEETLMTAASVARAAWRHSVRLRDLAEGKPLQVPWLSCVGKIVGNVLKSHHKRLVINMLHRMAY